MNILLSSIVGLIVVLILTPYIESDIVYFDYDHVTIAQRKPLDKDKKAMLSTLMVIAWLAPLVIAGWLILSMAADPNSRLGKMINPPTDECSTDTVIVCDKESRECHVAAETVTCGRDSATVIYQ